MIFLKGIRVIWQAWQRFNRHDAWAVSSHIAMSLLMAFFPFLIAVTALATFFGASYLSADAVDFIMGNWPKELANPMVREIDRVLTVKRTSVLTVSFLLALYFASSGVGGLRIGLNRAYGVRENRPWWWLRFSSILMVILGAVTMLSFALLIVLGSVIWKEVINIWPDLTSVSNMVAFMRIGIATLLFIVALFIVHFLLPVGWRGFRAVTPGIVMTVLLWILGGLGFGWYLEHFATNYAITYGSLATAMMTLVFLYLFAAIFLFGGEINGALIAARNEDDGGLKNKEGIP